MNDGTFLDYCLTGRVNMLFMKVRVARCPKTKYFRMLEICNTVNNNNGQVKFVLDEEAFLIFAYASSFVSDLDDVKMFFLLNTEYIKDKYYEWFQPAI